MRRCILETFKVDKKCYHNEDSMAILTTRSMVDCVQIKKKKMFLNHMSLSCFNVQPFNPA